MSEELDQRFPNLRPIGSAPSLWTVNGIGLCLYGRRDQDAETGSYVKTHWFTLVFLPLFGLGSYRVIDANPGWYFLGREPLSSSVKLWNLLMFCLVFVGGGTGGWYAYTHSPGYLAAEKLREADELASEGKLLDAADRYKEVAKGTTSHAPDALRKYRQLIDTGLSQAPLKEVAGIVRLTLNWQEQTALQPMLMPKVLETVRERGAESPREALALLDLVEPQDPLSEELPKVRKPLLEKLVAENPKDVQLVSELAVILERQNELSTCDKLLTPVAKDLGTTEGARVLGRIRASQNKSEEAYALLRPYVDEKLKTLPQAEQGIEEAFTSFHNRLKSELSSGTARDFPYERFKDADPAEQQTIYREFEAKRAQTDPGLRGARLMLIRVNAVVKVALDLGMVHLTRGKTAVEPKQREKEFKSAEELFLAVRGIAGAASDLQLAEVYHWLGREKEANELLDKVLKEADRSPAVLMEVAQVVRLVGDYGKARQLAEEAYQKEKDGPSKRNIAHSRALMSNETEERVVWLERAEQASPAVRASLCTARASLAEQKNDLVEAERQLREAIAIYSKLEESAPALNNCGLVYSELGQLTGNAEDLRQAMIRLEKSLQLDPRNSIGLLNLFNLYRETTTRNVLGDRINLKLLRSAADFSYLQYLYVDRAGREAVVERMRKDLDYAKALETGGRFILLAPKQPTGYGVLGMLQDFARDVVAQRKLLKTLGEVQLDQSDITPTILDQYAGKRDAKNIEDNKQAMTRVQSRLAELPQGKRDVHFAILSNNLANLLIAQSNLKGPAEPDRVVKLCEEAHAAAPSFATQRALVGALLFRAHCQLLKQDAGYAASAEKAKRMLDPSSIVTLAVSGEIPGKPAALANKDLQRAVALLRQLCDTFEDDNVSWRVVLLQAVYPTEGEKYVQRLAAGELDALQREIKRKLAPVSLEFVLEVYWALKLARKPQEAQAVLREVAKLGVALPFELR